MPSINLRISFLIAFVGTLGSLYFSEILKLPPCSLCWYQRICLYPLVFIFGAALWTDDRRYGKYSIPLLLTGLVISAYHNLLYYDVISQPLIPCTAEVSCSAKQLELFGFLTIPLLSLVSFILLVAIVLPDCWRNSNRKEIHE